MGITIRDLLYRVTFGGTMGPSEIFSYGFWVTTGTGVTAPQVADAAQDGLDAFFAGSTSASGFTDIPSMFDSNIAWTTITARPYSATTGLPTADAYTIDYNQAGTGTQSVPYQCAAVVTLWNGENHGKHKYNRFYLPPFVVAALTTAGQIFDGIATDLCLAIKDMDDAMIANAHPTGINVFQKVLHTVTGCNVFRMDTIIDTQRRRRDQLVPSLINDEAAS